MNLSTLERKLVTLALDPGASPGEIASAAEKLFRLFRRRYRDGYAFLRELAASGNNGHDGHGDEISWRRERWLYRHAIYGSTVVHFGKYRGQPIRNVPADYLIWILRNCSRLNSSTREAISGYLNL
jgi:hypothetical protein